MGNNAVHEEDLGSISNKAIEIASKKYQFQRLVLSKEEALEMFCANPFKV